MEIKEIKTAKLYSSLWNKNNIHYFNLTKSGFLNYVNETESTFKNKKVLDAGVGSGTTSNILSNIGADVYGVDINKKPEHYKGKFINASLLNLPFEDNSFDIVYCSGVLHHTLDARKGFNELSRVLRGGGKMILAIHGKSGLFGFGLKILRIFSLRVKTETLRKLLIKFLSKSTTENFLDYLCVPILNRYHEKEIRNWFKENKFKNIKRAYTNWYSSNSIFSCAKKDYNLIDRILHNEGWIIMKGEKQF